MKVLKKLLMLSLFCAGCVPHIETQKFQGNSRIKVIESRSITENTEVGIFAVDNVEYIVVCKNAYEGGVAIVKHEKPNKAEKE